MIKIVRENNKTIANLAIIDDIIVKNELTEIRNGVFEFSFDCLEQELKSKYITTNNKVLVGENLFDIKYIETNNSIGVTYKVTADHISYRLLDNNILNYSFTGTPSQILTDLLSNTDFTIGNIDFNDSIIFAVNRETSKLGVIRILAETLGGVLKFDDNGFNISIIQPVYNGKIARIKKNISSITKVIDNREELKTSYEIDLINIYQSDDLILEGFEDFEKITSCDIIRVIDETLDIDIFQDVVKTKRNAIKDEKTSVTLANTLDGINDDLITFSQNAVNKDEYIYGVKINNDIGIQIERTDKLARAEFNADNFKMQVGDGLGAYTNALSFDPIAGKYKFVGSIEATGTITGANIIGGSIVGGSINIGSGTFTVNSSGDVVANSLTMSGGSILSANINIAQDIRVGNNIYVGNSSSTGTKSLIFYQGGTDSVFINSSNGDLTVRAWGGQITIDSDFTELTGYSTYKGNEIATKPWVQSQGYLTSGSLSGYATISYVNSAISGYATASYVNSYAVRDLSSQGIEMQIFSDHLEVRQAGGVWKIIAFS